LLARFPAGLLNWTRKSPDTGGCASADLAWLVAGWEAWAGITPLRKRIGFICAPAGESVSSKLIAIRLGALLGKSRGFTQQL
jgi:hypothetical protein